MSDTGSLLVTSGSPNTPTMRLAEIVSEICKRVNDPFEDNYADRAKELFVASAYQGLSDPKWTKFDYHGYVGDRTFSNGENDKRIFRVFGDRNDITGDTGSRRRTVLNIVDVVSQNLSEDNFRTRKYVPIDISEANRIATDADLEPIHGEVYWYIAGDRLYFHPSPNESMRFQDFIIEYMVAPLDFNIQEDMLNFFSTTYIYDAIDVATGKLLAEIGLA